MKITANLFLLSFLDFLNPKPSTNKGKPHGPKQKRLRFAKVNRIYENITSESDDTTSDGTNDNESKGK